MLLKRTAQAAFLALVLGAVGLGLAWTAHALSWTKVTVDDTVNVDYTSIAATADGRLVVSYRNSTNGDLMFTMCDLPGTGCDADTDWLTPVTVDSGGQLGRDTSIAVNANGDPVISYYDAAPNDDLRFAICDLSATGCDQDTDWTKYTVDSGGQVGQYSSIAVDANGDPVISYNDAGSDDLKFARCDMSATSCDQDTDWTLKYTVDSSGTAGQHNSIAVNADGDPMIAYRDGTTLAFAICDMSATGGCDQAGDWTKDIQVQGAGGQYTSIAVDGNGDPMISDYNAGTLRFARCDMSTGCSGAGNWTVKYTVDSGTVGQYTSLASYGSAVVISYYANGDLKFAKCGLASGCDADTDWIVETADSQDDVGTFSSVAIRDWTAAVSYQNATNGDLKVALAYMEPYSVGGIAELPDIAQAPASHSGPSTGTYAALAGGLAAAIVALGAGAWYARRRWVR